MALSIVHQDSINLTNLPDVPADVSAGKIVGSWWNKSLNYSGTLETSAGGTGLDGSAAANGRLLIGNGAGYTLATLTASTNVTITNGAGSISIAAASTPPAGSSGQVQYNGSGAFAGASAVTIDGSGNLSAPATYGAITADTDGATITFNFAAANKHKVTLGGNRTLVFSNDSVGQTMTLILAQDATGSRTVTWPSGIRWSGGGAPTLTATASKEDWITIIKMGAGDYRGFLSGQNL